MSLPGIPEGGDGELQSKEENKRGSHVRDTPTGSSVAVRQRFSGVGRWVGAEHPTCHEAPHPLREHPLQPLWLCGLGPILCLIAPESSFSSLPRHKFLNLFLSSNIVILCILPSTNKLVFVFPGPHQLSRHYETRLPVSTQRLLPLVTWYGSRAGRRRGRRLCSHHPATSCHTDTTTHTTIWTSFVTMTSPASQPRLPSHTANSLSEILWRIARHVPYIPGNIGLGHSEEGRGYAIITFQIFSLFHAAEDSEPKAARLCGPGSPSKPLSDRLSSATMA